MPFIAPIVSAVGGIVASASSFLGALGPIGKAVVGLGASFGLSAVSSALAPKPKAGMPLTGMEFAEQLGGDIPRQIPVGVCRLAGHRVYSGTWGAKNERYDRVLVLGDWLLDGIEAVIIDGVRRAVTVAEADGALTVYAVADTPELVLRFWDGGQAMADPYLVANANPAGRWTADDVGHGVAYVVACFSYDAEAGLYEGGFPEVAFITRGARLYDWRADDTAGGEGAQRWDDPGSWAFSDNSVVALWNFQRGFHRGGRRLLGMGVPAYDLSPAHYTAAANACDEEVALLEGGTEPRYRCALVLTDDKDVPFRVTLDALRATFAGHIYDHGVYVVQAGVAQATAATITDADLVVGEPVTFAARQRGADLVNAIHGQFLDPGALWLPASYTPQVDGAAQDEDGGEKATGLDLLAVPARTQAERIARIRLREARLQAEATITLGKRQAGLRPGDWIVWTSATYGTRTWRIVRLVRDRATARMVLDLREIAASVFGWSSADEGPAPALPVPIQPGTRISTAPGFAVAAVAITGEGGSEIPSLRFTWTPIEDATVDSVVIEYRRYGTEERTVVVDDSPGDGVLLVTSGIVNGRDYEARATIRTTPARLTTWTAWIAVTTTASMSATLAAEIQRQIEQYLPAAMRGVQERLEQLGGLQAAADAGAYNQLSEVRRMLGDASASLTQQITVATGSSSALAQQVTELSASLGAVSADLDMRWVAVAAPDGALAAYELRAQAGGSYAGMTVIAESGEKSVVAFDADRFLIRIPSELGGGVLPALSVSEEPDSPGDALLVFNGAIAAESLSAIAADLGEIVAGTMTGPSGRLIVDLNNERITVDDGE